MQVKKEIQVWCSLHHPNTVELFHIAQSPSYTCFVMELCQGGELFDRIVLCGKLSQAEARKHFRQILFAVRHCHALGFAHRDLKPVRL